MPLLKPELRATSKYLWRNPPADNFLFPTVMRANSPNQGRSAIHLPSFFSIQSFEYP